MLTCRRDIVYYFTDGGISFARIGARYELLELRRGWVHKMQVEAC